MLQRFSLLTPVIKTLIIINVAVFLIEILVLNSYNINYTPLKAYYYHFFALQPLDGSFYPWQLITYQFMHGSFWHLFFNLFALWMFGTELEAMWGSRKFFIYYLICGIGAGLTQLFIAPLLGQVGPTIGASGAVYGILLAFGLTFPNRPIFMFPIFIPIPAKIFVIIYAGLALFLGLTGSDNIAHFAHLGGALTGFILLKLERYTYNWRIFKRRNIYNNTFYEYDDEPLIYRMQSRESSSTPKQSTFTLRQRKSKFEVEGEEISQAMIDEILDKISVSGYQSLTEKEKKILFELSKKL